MDGNSEASSSADVPTSQGRAASRAPGVDMTPYREFIKTCECNTLVSFPLASDDSPRAIRRRLTLAGKELGVRIDHLQGTEGNMIRFKVAPTEPEMVPAPAQDDPAADSPDAAAPVSEELPADETGLIEDSSDETASWRETLSAALLSMPPDAFERLCQRLLRKSGFIEVAVTGRSGDGGIDGHGIIRLAGLISFPVVFQCKRYTNNVSAGTVRDFRGAMVGRADKGLILTTGGFTRDAHREATRDGAPPIDLIDGELLMDRLKELGLGVSVKTVEVVEVDKKWFDSI